MSGTIGFGAFLSGMKDCNQADVLAPIVATASGLNPEICAIASGLNAEFCGCLLARPSTFAFKIS
jgi:hypothetical protein